LIFPRAARLRAALVDPTIFPPSVSSIPPRSSSAGQPPGNPFSVNKSLPIFRFGFFAANYSEDTPAVAEAFGSRHHGERIRISTQSEVAAMTTHSKSDKTEGKVDKAAGKAKEAAGKMTKDRELEGKGKAQQAKGDAKSAKGNLKDATKPRH
jgi:uncharacterized protein YjbJ (UPF0337 family)